MNESKFINRYRRQKFWILFLILGIATSILIALEVTKEFDCKNYQRFSIYLINGTVFLVAFINIGLKGYQALIERVFSLAIILILGIGIPFFSGQFVADVEGVIKMFCPKPLISTQSTDCERAEKDFNQEYFDSAERYARECIAIGQQENRMDIKDQGEIILAKILTRKAENIIDNAQCDVAPGVLSELEMLTQDGNAAEAYQGDHYFLYKLYSNVCFAPTPTVPTPITPQPTNTPIPLSYEFEMMRTKLTEKSAIVDFRVKIDDLPVRELTAENFLLGEETQITFTFEARDADDEVCIISVLDNSGSIGNVGVGHIHQAVDRLNLLRKPKDELGLVVFSDEHNIHVQKPEKGPKDPSRVDGSGQYTPLWKASEIGIQSLGNCISEDRYLIVMTDGENNIPFTTPDGSDPPDFLRREANQQSIVIYAIGVGLEDAAAIADLQALATDSSETYIPVDNFDELTTEFSEIFGKVREFYRIIIPITELPANNEVTIVFDDKSGNSTTETVNFDDSD